MASIIVKRGKLKEVYTTLSNDEKSKWAERARYNDYRGLYRYVHSNPNANAYERILLGLKEAVGEERFKTYIYETSNVAEKNEIMDLVDNFCKQVVAMVADSSNRDELNEVAHKLSKVERFVQIQAERTQLLDEFE